MTDLLLCDAKLDDGNVTVYDMTMGTSQMLSCMEERIHELNSDVEVTCFGQEFNPSTFAIAKADMMIRGGDPNNMRFGDTLSDDQFPGFTFQYCISNPPFGIDWKREKKAVEAEAAKGELGRFAPGLPKSATASSFLCSTACPSWRRAAKWRSFRTARRCLPVTPEAAPAISVSISWKTIGWTPLSSFPPTSL